MKHKLFREEDRFICSVCLRHWKNEPSSICPGVPVYEWGAAPDHLLTQNQLHKKRLIPPSEAKGIVGKWLLYDIADATPYTEAQLEELREKQRESRRRRRLRIEMANQARKDFVREQSERRDNAIAWARNLIAEGRALILDTETTGLGYDAEVISIAIIDISGETVFETLVQPEGEIEPEAIEVHGITQERLEVAPKFGDIYGELKNWIQPGRQIIAYNAEFDSRILAQSARRMGVVSIGLFFEPANCAMVMYADFVGEWSDRYGRNKWQRLPGGNHSANGDARATLNLIREMAAAKLSTESETLEG